VFILKDLNVLISYRTCLFSSALGAARPSPLTLGCLERGYQTVVEESESEKKERELEHVGLSICNAPSSSLRRHNLRVCTLLANRRCQQWKTAICWWPHEEARSAVRLGRGLWIRGSQSKPSILPLAFDHHRRLRFSLVVSFYLGFLHPPRPTLKNRPPQQQGLSLHILLPGSNTRDS
jgi:hypothetical protein